MKYAIKLRSKYTGDEIYLGCKYNTMEEAEKYIKEGVCERCNSTSIYPVNEEAIWKNKNTGFW